MPTSEGDLIEIRRTQTGEYVCPVCGFIQQHGCDPPYWFYQALDADKKPSGGWWAFASFNLCVCGTEYGYDDYVQSKDNLTYSERWTQLRGEWLDRVGRTSEAIEQLRNLGINMQTRENGSIAASPVEEDTVRIHLIGLSSCELLEIVEIPKLGFICPVCGFMLGDRRPYVLQKAMTVHGASEHGFIGIGSGTCPCCQTRFGHDDSRPEASVKEQWKELREKWLQRVGDCPEVRAQLLNLEKDC